MRALRSHGTADAATAALLLILVLLLTACTGGSDAPAPDRPTTSAADVVVGPGEVVLTDAGVVTAGGLLPFGAPSPTVIEAVAEQLGDPITQTDIRPSDGLECPPPTHQFVGWPGLTLTFLGASDYRDDGVDHLARWLLSSRIASASLPTPSGDRIAVVPTVTTAGELRAGMGEDIEVVAVGPDQPAAALDEFVIRSLDEVVFGGLTGTGDDDVVFNVTAGRGCGRTPDAS